jgi:hypothetical protein
MLAAVGLSQLVTALAGLSASRGFNPISVENSRAT